MPALLLFWAVALNAWIHLRLEESYFWTLVMAFAIGLGLLSKYAMFYFVLALLLATIFDKKSKQVFFSLKGLVLALISSCVILPNLIWNYKNNFVTIFPYY
jgi:4-amino-4-deoxy-L-arabinose transferase-like glycosyltransferase